MENCGKFNEFLKNSLNFLNFYKKATKWLARRSRSKKSTYKDGKTFVILSE